MSFLGIGILWLHHHAMFGAIVRIDRRLTLANFLGTPYGHRAYSPQI
jgi:uncharacterized membrane protein